MIKHLPPFPCTDGPYIIKIPHIFRFPNNLLGYVFKLSRGPRSLRFFSLPSGPHSYLSNLLTKLRDALPADPFFWYYKLPGVATHFLGQNATSLRHEFIALLSTLLVATGDRYRASRDVSGSCPTAPTACLNFAPSLRMSFLLEPRAAKRPHEAPQSSALVRRNMCFRFRIIPSSISQIGWTSGALHEQDDGAHKDISIPRLNGRVDVCARGTVKTRDLDLNCPGVEKPFSVPD